jgi:predicted nucleic acid-binding protein
MILVDSNIPMYLIGSPGPLKTDAQRLLERLVSDRQRLVTDAEVFQEILHRYASVNRRHDIQRAFDTLLNAVDEIFPVGQETIERAKQIVLSYREFSARDAIHLAVMKQHGIHQILSFDTSFDRFPGIKRLA